MRNLLGEFISLTVVAFIAAAFFQIVVKIPLELTFGVFWAFGIVAWVFVLSRRYPALDLALKDIGHGVVAAYHWRPNSPSSISRVTRFRVEPTDRRCPYCHAINLPEAAKCVNCAASL